MMQNKLKEVYYSPQALWTGHDAAGKLSEASGIKDKNFVRKWLSKQAFYQVHMYYPKTIERPHYFISEPNYMHQFDLLYMTGDKVYGSKYKYILAGIDVASRFKIARPLRTKKAEDVAFLLKHIYENDKIPLTYPKLFQCDNGSEFKSSVTKLLENNGVQINRTTTKYKHTHTAFVERLNETLSKNLYKIQDAQELNDPSKIATTWVKHLYELVDRLNERETRMTGIKPVNAIKMKSVKLREKYKYPKEKILPLNSLYRYLLMPGEEHGDQKRRATDRIWSKNVYRIDKALEQTNNRVMYYLKDGPKRSFVYEELLGIPDDTENPPDYVQNW